MSARSFPGTWRVEHTEGGHFVVKDATGFSVCYVYALGVGEMEGPLTRTPGQPHNRGVSISSEVISPRDGAP
jgi:hypothetical protein